MVGAGADDRGIDSDTAASVVTTVVILAACTVAADDAAVTTGGDIGAGAAKLDFRSGCGLK